MEKIWLKKYPKGVSPEVDFSNYSSLFDLYEESIRMFNTKKAFTNMGVSLTFNELDRRVDQFASFLQNELKLKKGDRIAIQMPNLLQFPIVAFAALRSGLTIVNTNPLYTAKEMQHQFKDSGAKAIVILANYAHLLEQILKDTNIESIVVTEIGDMFPTPKRILVNSVVKYIKKMVPAYNLPQAYSFRQALELGAMKPSQKIATTLEDIAFLQYTGGTTGVAKGAMLLHRNVLANVLQIRDWMKPKLREGEEIAIAALPLYHIFALTLNCLGLLRYGAENVLITNPRDIPGFIKELKKVDFTIMAGVNTLFNALMNNPEFMTVNFSRVKVSVAGAMTLQKSVAEKWMELTKSVIVEGYGLTEASPVVCCNPIDGTDKVGTIGLPFPSTDVKLLNDDNQEVPMGEAGELCCKGPQVMAGYWNRPDETAKVIVDGWLKTGDVAVFDNDGFLKIVDRKKDMILVSGFNVYPNEVEEAIASHPGVLEVAAIGIPDEHSGEIVKVFVVKKDDKLTAEEVIAHARKSLTNYKVPRLVEFRTELPKTNVGKILRRALRENPK
ncbi:AMP-binding protein [Bdellovibrio sp. 22V]|uniref:AMP-binding protein n=1 Tax=Bdellovibrio sp. 22V TaxID=3044166 RepID=UPI002543BFD0|nr:AMP-binding protein [Bdellovibrio sp. 22V]WII70874.1 AMP-binding protein [Bdellovibrio sp. 22V]